MKALEELCCQNSKCARYGQRGRGNLSACGWIDKRRTIRQIYCSVCKARFSERKGTPLYNAKLPTDKVVSILDHMRKGCGVRQTGRLPFKLVGTRGKNLQRPQGVGKYVPPPALCVGCPGLARGAGHG